MANKLTAERWQKIEELFLAALEREPNERRAFLDEACARDNEAQKLIDELNERSRREYVSPLAIAIIHLGLGEVDKGIELLEKAYEERDTILVYFLRFPHFDSLRADTRFQDLMKRFGFQ